MDLKTTHLDAVSAVITYRISPSGKEEFSNGLKKLINSLRLAEGYLGSKVICRIASGVVEFLFIVTFDTEERLSNWQKSPEVCEWEHEATALFIEGPRRDTFRGAEIWCVLNDSAQAVDPPPKYKLAIMSWLGIFPLVSLFLGIGGPYLNRMTFWPRVIVLTVVIVALMTYVVTPWLKRRLEGWLQSGSRSRVIPAMEIWLNNGEAKSKIKGAF